MQILDVPPKSEPQPGKPEWIVITLLLIAIYLLAIWWGFPDWLHALFAQDIGWPGENC